MSGGRGVVLHFVLLRLCIARADAICTFDRASKLKTYLNQLFGFAYFHP